MLGKQEMKKKKVLSRRKWQNTRQQVYNVRFLFLFRNIKVFRRSKSVSSAINQWQNDDYYRRFIKHPRNGETPPSPSTSSRIRRFAYRRRIRTRFTAARLFVRRVTSSSIKYIKRITIGATLAARYRWYFPTSSASRASNRPIREARI